MKAEQNPPPPDPAAFLVEAGKLAAEFGWPTKSLNRDSEVALVAKTASDPMFDRFVWIYDTSRTTLRCLLASSQSVPQKREAAILELCARINEGLPFGCAEYSFSDRIVVFRNSADLDYGPLEKVVGGATARVMHLGSRYGAAIRDTIKGEKPLTAAKNAEAASQQDK